MVSGQRASHSNSKKNLAIHKGNSSSNKHLNIQIRENAGEASRSNWETGEVKLMTMQDSFKNGHHY